MDEYEHYNVQQVIAAIAGQPSIDTLVLIGDVHQRLNVPRPTYTRTLWQKLKERRASIELDDEGEGEDDRAPQQPSPGASSAASANVLRNPRERYFSDWVEPSKDQQLTVCKRCGPQVTNFVAATFDFASNFTSSEDNDTWLWYVFYDGNGWGQSPFDYSTRGETKRRKLDDHLGWHHSLYGALLLMCMKDLEWVKWYVPKHKQTHPPIAIAVPLERVATPLAVLCSELFGEQVKVLTHHSIRGMTVNIVHGVRHRRKIEAEDQFMGVQEDPQRDYMVQTRGLNKTVMWQEVQPFGTPRRREGQAQAPDSRLKEKGHKGSKSGKGSKGKAKEEGTNKQEKYAMRVLKAIEAQHVKWFDLGVSSPTDWDKSWHWADTFQREFPKLHVTEDEVWSVNRTLHRCWNKMVSGKADVPKELAKRKQEFQDVKTVLEALVPSTNAASELRAEAESMKAFATAHLDDLRTVGHGMAMKTWAVQLPEDRRVNPENPEHVDLALGFGIVLTPCAIVQLSENQRAGKQGSRSRSCTRRRAMKLWSPC